MSALTWAHVVAVQYSHLGAVCLYFDSMFAGKVAGATWGVGSYTAIARTLSSMQTLYWCSQSSYVEA